MNKRYFFIFALYVGIQSFLLQLIDQLIGKSLVPGGHNGFVFIAFQGWALYFLLGSTLRGAVTGFCGYVMGILFAVLMIAAASAFSGLQLLAVPVTALVIVPVMMYFEYAPLACQQCRFLFCRSRSVLRGVELCGRDPDPGSGMDRTVVLFIRADQRMDDDLVPKAV